MIASGRYYSLIGEIERRIDEGHLEAALDEIVRVAHEVFSSKLSSPRAIGSVELDRLCLRVGETLPFSAAVEAVPEGECDVYLATEVYPSGGHSLWISDLMRARPERRAVLLLTNTLRHEPDPDALRRFTEMGVVVEVGAVSLSHVSRLRWVRRQLARYRPVELNLMTHMHDAVAIAATQPGVVPTTVFFHHCDHEFSLGVHLPHALHVDFRPVGHRNCREGQRLEHNVCVPLVSDNEAPASRPFKRGGLKTCTSGDYKFDLPYAFHFSRVIPAFLEKSGGTHHHIGPLSSATVAATRERLDELGIAQDRFEVHLRCPSLWRRLVELDIDVYLDSFPLAGCKSVIEAIGAGIPVVVHENYTNPLFSGGNVAYPEAFCWRHPEELVAFVSTVDVAWLEQQSACARRHFERENLPDVLAQRLAALHEPALARAQNPETGIRPDPLASLWDFASSALDPNGYLFHLHSQAARGVQGGSRSIFLRGVDTHDWRGLLESCQSSEKSVESAVQMLRMIDLVHPFLRPDEEGEASLSADKTVLTDFLFSLAAAPPNERDNALALLHAVTGAPHDAKKPTDAHHRDKEISKILFQLTRMSRSRKLSNVVTDFVRRFGSRPPEGV